MKNLFLINTPFQLLSAFIVANSYEKDSQNYLIVLRPNEYENWRYSTGIQYMLQDNSTWERVFTAHKWLERSERISSYKKQIEEMKERINSVGLMDHVFLGSDKIIQNQLMVEVAGCTSYSLLDEGIGSYDSDDRDFLSKMRQYLRIKFYKYIGNIQGDMKYNFRGIGYGPSNIADYLHRPELLSRKSKCTKQIFQKDVQSILPKIISYMEDIPILMQQPSIIFLGSTFMEQSDFIQKEVEVLQNLYQIAEKKQLRLIYKTHHSENQDKLNIYQQKYPKMSMLKSLEPVELLYHKYRDIKYVISFASSGMLYINTFTSQEIKPIVVYKLYGQREIKPRIQKIFKESALFTPEDWAEMESYLNNLFY